MFSSRSLLLALLVLAIVLVASALRPSAAGAGEETFYTVRPGDTLWEIATTHYSRDPRKAVWQIKRANDLEDALIQPGDVLVLPT